jgi:mRNA-degrading endonuclease YafQ of YafQ-DinJ toxin-antitoxin module
MDNKKALCELRDNAQFLALFKGNEARKYIIYVADLYNTIKQDLERLETLKTENKKFKKVIEILKDKLELDLDYEYHAHSYTLETKYSTNYINDQEYELINEVLGNA